MRKILLFALVALSTAYLSGCNNDENPPDVDPPVISIVSPAEHSNYPAGEDLLFNATFSDNELLGTYSIDMHNTFDDHQHGRISEDPELIKFSYKQNYSLPALTFYAAEENISIPSNTMSGAYHFIVQSIDAAGNATSFQNGTNVSTEIYITNSSMALISITNLVNDKLELIPETAFIVEGSISDPDHPSLSGISEVSIILGEEHEHNMASGKLAEEQLYSINYTSEELNQFKTSNGTWDLSSMINYTPDNATFEALSGEDIDQLLLWIYVIDNQGNRSYLETAVLLKP